MAGCARHAGGADESRWALTRAEVGMIKENEHRGRQTQPLLKMTPTPHPPHIHDHHSHYFSIDRPADQHHLGMGLGSTMTGRQSTFCSPHISRCKADIGYVQSTKHTTVSTQQALSAARRRSATPHSTEMGHTPTMNTSRQVATHTLFGGHTERRSG